MRISDLLRSPLTHRGGWTAQDREDRVGELLELVGLSRSFSDQINSA